MLSRNLVKFIIVFATIGMVSSSYAGAQKDQFQATIVLIQGKPIFIDDFNSNGEHFYYAIQKGKKIKLPFKDIKTIRFLNPGKNYKAEVIFKDDTKNTYVLKPAANIVIKSRASIVTLSHTKVAKIEFGPSRRQAETDYSKFDGILLKSFDSVHGQIQTKIFKVRTPYGNLNFETSRIRYISFDGRGKNIDVIALKNGDKLSGVVETESVKLLTRSGKEVNLDSEKIKRITFKKAKLVRDEAIKKQ
jgi:hypothetical protein